MRIETEPNRENPEPFQPYKLNWIFEMADDIGVFVIRMSRICFFFLFLSNIWIRTSFRILN